MRDCSRSFLYSSMQVEEASCNAQAFAPEPVPPPQLLARFRVNQQDTLAVFKAVSMEDFGDVASLLPPNTALPAADKMTYLLARLEVRFETGYAHTALACITMRCCCSFARECAHCLSTFDNV